MTFILTATSTVMHNLLVAVNKQRTDSDSLSSLVEE